MDFREVMILIITLVTIFPILAQWIENRIVEDRQKNKRTKIQDENRRREYIQMKKRLEYVQYKLMNKEQFLRCQIK